jgi:hypothetical protein
VAIQTVLFVSQSIVKLISAYPSRSVGRRMPRNTLLHLCVWGGVALQLSTPLVPQLRGVLHLAVLSATGWLAVALAVALAWAGTELLARLALRWRAAPSAPSASGAPR